MRRLHFWSNHLLEGKGMHTDCYLTLTCWLKYYTQQPVLTTKKGPHSGPLPKSYVQSYKDIWLQIHVGFTQCILIMINLSRRTILLSHLLWALFSLENNTLQYNLWSFGKHTQANLPHYATYPGPATFESRHGQLQTHLILAGYPTFPAYDELKFVPVIHKVTLSSPCVWASCHPLSPLSVVSAK